MAEATLTLTFDRDWHLGTGQGIPGLKDKLVSRDADDLPQVPAKSLFGIWRDAAQRLAWALDEGQPGRWHGWVAALFGEELGGGAPGRPLRPASLTLTAAQLDLPALRQPGTPRLLKEALVFTKPGVRVDPDSGRARPGHLRFIEMATGGLTLRARAGFDGAGWDPVQHQAAWAFLAGALALVEAVGAGRRRGQGFCTLKLEGWDGAKAAAALRATQATAKRRTEAAPKPLPGVPVAAGERRQRVTVRLLAPLVVADQVRGNVVLTRRHLPGSLLLAALFPRLVARLGEAGARTAIAANRLRVLQATPAVTDDACAPRRGEPGPLVLWAVKEGGGLDRAGTTLNLATQEPDGNRQYKAARNLFLAPADQPAARLPDFLRADDVPTILTTHNTIDDERQRPVSQEEGGVGPGVYSYGAIAAAGPFIGEIRFAHGVPALDAARFQARLGRSRKDHGLVEITIGDPEPLPGAAPPVGTELWVRLLSDTIPLGEALGPAATVDALRLDLQRTLGVTLARLPAARRATEAVRIVRVESWQTRWSLPRPTLAALGAGSVIGFTVAANPDPAGLPARLAEVQARGLGDRCAEGFGDLRFQDPLVLASLKDAEPGARRALDGQKADSAPTSGSAGGVVPSNDLLTVQRIAWQREIAVRALIRAADPVVRRNALGLAPSGGPSASQLGRVREKIAGVQGSAGARTFLEWLNRAESFGEIHAAMARLIAGDGAPVLWKLVFDENQHPLELPGRAADRAALERELWPFAFRHFAFAMLRAHSVARRAEPAEAG